MGVKPSSSINVSNHSGLFMILYLFVNGFATVSLKVSGTHASDFFTPCLNVQVANYLAVPISFVLIVIEVNGALHIPNKRASGWLVFATEVGANHIRATVTRGFFFLQWLKFNVIVFHNLFLVPVFEVKRGIKLGIPTGLLFVTLAVDLPPSFHLCEPLVEVALESVLFLFVFHNLLTASSIP